MGATPGAILRAKRAHAGIQPSPGHPLLGRSRLGFLAERPHAGPPRAPERHYQGPTEPAPGASHSLVPSTRAGRARSPRSRRVGFLHRAMAAMPRSASVPETAVGAIATCHGPVLRRTKRHGPTGSCPHRRCSKWRPRRGCIPAPPPLPPTGRRGGNHHQPDRGPLGPPIWGGWGHPVWAVASEDDAVARGINGARSCPRRAAMVPTTTKVGGDGERQATVVVVGRGGGGTTRSTSMGADVDDPASPTGTGGDGDTVGRPHSTTDSGTTTVHPWRT